MVNKIREETSPCFITCTNVKQFGTCTEYMYNVTINEYGDKEEYPIIIYYF